LTLSRGIRENTEGNRSLIPPLFPCDPRLCNDSRACCAATIFLHSPFSLSRLASVPLTLALVHSCLHRSPSPLYILALVTCHRSPVFCHRHRHRLIMSTRRCSTPTHRHLRFSRFSSARSQALENVAFLPLPLSLFSPGDIPELSMQTPFCITVCNKYLVTIFNLSFPLTQLTQSQTFTTRHIDFCDHYFQRIPRFSMDSVLIASGT